MGGRSFVLACLCCISLANLAPPAPYPTLSVPDNGFKLQNPAAGAENNYPSPSSTISFTPTSNCKQHIILRVTNIVGTSNVDIKIGDQTIGQNLGENGLTQVWCATALPPSPQTAMLSVVKMATTEPVCQSFVVPTGTFVDGTAKMVSIVLPAEPTGNPNVTVDDYLFPWAADHTYLTLPTPVSGSPKWTLNCNAFVLGTEVECILAVMQNTAGFHGTYGVFGQLLQINIYWSMHPYSNPMGLTYEAVQFTPVVNSGQWGYEGFLAEAPTEISPNDQITAFGAFHVLQAASYGVYLRCTGTTFEITLKAHNVTDGKLVAVAPPANDWTGVTVSSQCIIQVVITMSGGSPITVPSASVNVGFFTYSPPYTAQSKPLVFAVELVKMNHATLTAAPGDQIRFITHASCTGLMFYSKYGLGGPIDISLNGTKWGTGIEVNHMTMMRCAGAGIPGVQVPWEISQGGVSKATGAILASSYLRAQWNVIDINEQGPAGPPVLAPVETEWPLDNLKCSLHNPSPLEFQAWELECPPPVGRNPPLWYLNETVTCKIPADKVGHFPPTPYGILNIKCNFSYPTNDNAGMNDVTNIQFLQTDIPYIGFVSEILGNTIVANGPASKIGITGRFEWEPDQFSYSCKYMGIDNSHQNQVSEVKVIITLAPRSVLECEGPDNVWMNYPINGNLFLVRTNIGTGKEETMPGPSEITITGPSVIPSETPPTTPPTPIPSGTPQPYNPIHSPAPQPYNPINSPQLPTTPQPYNPIHPPSGKHGDGGKIAGIVIGVLLGLAVIGGGVGAYWYFFINKKRQGFVAVE